MPLIVSKKDAAKYGAKQDAAGNYVVGGGSSSKKSSSGLSTAQQKTLSAIKAGGGNQELEGTEGYGVSGKRIVPRIKTTSPVLSSKDMDGTFGKQSEKYEERARTSDVLQTALNGRYGPEAQRIAQENEQKRLDEERNATEKKSEEEPGDEFTDSMDAYGKHLTESGTAAIKELEGSKARAEKEYKSSLSTYDQSYRAAEMNLSQTYDVAIAEQQKINKLTLDRAQAYGASGGNALYTPMEFTNAIAERQQEGATAIRELELERAAKLAQAKAARDEGKVLALKQYNDDLDDIEENMRNRLTDTNKEILSLAKLMKDYRLDVEDRQKEEDKEMMESIAAMYGQTFRDAETPEEQEKVVLEALKKAGIANSTRSFGLAFGALQAQSGELAKAEREASKAKLDEENTRSTIRNREQQTAIAWRNSNTSASREARLAKEEESGGFDTINDLIGLTDEDGVPFTDESGYFTKEGFKRLEAAAKEDGITRKEFLQEYGHLLSPDNLDAYGLTAADRKLIEE